MSKTEQPTQPKTTVVVKLQVEGLHQWKDAPDGPISFLREPHRHIFYIQCEKQVNHADRDIEIISLKREIEEYLMVRFYAVELKIHNFMGMSCEMIGLILVDTFNLSFCEVLEDNENGARIYAKRD